MVGNKADLRIRRVQPLSDRYDRHADVRFSAATGVGEAALVQGLLERCGALTDGALLVALNQRHDWRLRPLTPSAVSRWRPMACLGISTIDLRQAIHSLGEITGESSPNRCWTGSFRRIGK